MRLQQTSCRHGNNPSTKTETLQTRTNGMERGAVMDGYKVLGTIGHGAHGFILKARQRSNGETVALKKIFIKRLDEGIPVQTLREILSLQNLRHKNIITLRHMFPHGPGFVLVFDFMITDMAKLVKDINLPPMNTSTLKFYFQQILSALVYMHDDCGIMHRNMKLLRNYFLMHCNGAVILWNKQNDGVNSQSHPKMKEKLLCTGCSVVCV
uniref:Cyclin-dependent kinase 20 n=1 Tax=Romanomermis culicivorax TaxID=13658 RepID=A0A915IEV9_ROMCU